MGTNLTEEIWWEKPTNGFLKLNFDGSRIEGNRAALGYSIRDHNSKVVLLGAKKCGSNSILVAEALALKEGILVAKYLGISKLIVEGDNLCVINSIRGTWQIPWEISSIIKDVKLDLHFFDEVIIKHCFREANKVAEFMASVGHSCPTLSRWFDSRWIQLTSLIRKCCAEASCKR